MRMPEVWIALLLLAPAGAFGQSVDATVGGSQILGLAGAQASYRYKGSYGWTGIGYYSGSFQVAGYSNVPLHFGFTPTNEINRDRYRLGVGDQELNTWLTTDEYDFYNAIVRGASVYRHTKASDIQVFVGSYSAEDRQPYLRAITQFDSKLIGAVVGHFTLPKKWELESFNSFGKGATSIQSFAWKPSRRWHLTTAAGVGSNDPYFASAAEYRRGELDLRGSYTFASDHLRRQGLNYDVEPLGLNAKAEVPLWRNTTAHFYHRHELMVVPESLGFKQNSSIGTIDSASFATSLFGFRSSVSLSQSTSNAYAGKNYSGIGSVSRNVLPRWRSTFSYLHNQMRSQDIVVYQDLNEVRVNNHLALTHTFDKIDGSTTNTFGGRWSSNAVSFSIDDQVYTSQIAAQFGQKSVFQAWNFSIRFRTPHGTSAHLETIVDPQGKTQLGGYLSGLQYQTLQASAQQGEHVVFSKYVIHGRVVDESGSGVWGIALQIGQDVVYSDTKGAFFVHVKSTKPVPLAVTAKSSLQAAPWKLESAPSTVRGVPEGNSDEPVLIVVQMTRHDSKEMASR
jgi:hypothetical protein